MDGRDEATRWINIALNLLVNRDLVGTKTFAMRAKEADPTIGYAEEILAVVDTLMAGQQQQVNGRYDWYGILRVERMCRDTEVIASEYRRLALLLNPQRNGLPFAEEAFGLVNEAWSVLSNPLRKSLYDNELSWLDGGSGSGVRVQQHQFLPMQSQSQVQQQQQQPPQVVTPVRVQPQVVTPLRAQQQQQYQHAQQQVQQQAPYQPQPQPHMQFEQLTQQARVQSQSVRQPQVQVQSFPQARVQSQPVAQPQAQRQSQQRVQSQQVIQPQAQRPSQPQVQSQPVTQPQVKPQGHPHYQQQQQQQQQIHQQQTQQRPHEPIVAQVDSNPLTWKTPVRNIEQEEVEVEELETDPVEVAEDEVPTFWTACPYCYHLFEYLTEYEDCTLRCQNKNCRRAFHGSAIAPPPESKLDKKASFCSWGFFPIGASPVYLNRGRKEIGKHSWHPFSPMFTCPMEPSKGVAPVDPNSWNKAQPNPKPKAVIVDDDDDYVLMELSDSADDSDADWGSNSTRRKKRGRPPKVQKSPVRKSARRGVVEKSKSGTSEAGDHVLGNNGSTPDAFASDGVRDASTANVTSSKSGLNGNVNLFKKASGKNPKDLGKLDLNVEFHNEVEETMSTKTSTNGAETSAGAGTSTDARGSTGAGTGTTSGAEENIEAEGIGFFEGLDEFLNSLPILSAVGDDKVKAA